MHGAARFQFQLLRLLWLCRLPTGAEGGILRGFAHHGQRRRALSHRAYETIPPADACALRTNWTLARIMVVMDVFTRSIIGFGVAAADLDGPVICRMFNRAIAKQTPPKYLSSDHDPLFRFHRWLANLRILGVDEIKAISGTPVPMLSLSDRSGRYGASILIELYFGTRAIWSGSSRTTKSITTNTGVTPG
jgi:hypothetical protein